MSYANPDSLVTTDWLNANLSNPNVRVVEVDEDATVYDKEHIPGAIAWSWSDDLHHPLRRDYLDQEGFSNLLSDAGVGPETTVVLYGGNNNWFAAYAYWLLKYRGFDNVKLLDGGRKKWNVDSLPLESEKPEITPTRFTISGAERPQLRAFRDHVLETLGSTTLVDVRSPEEFSGEKIAPDHLPQEQPYVAGHIPGAKNIPWGKAANEDGTFKSAEELRELYQGAGVDGGEIIAYCRIGERSSHSWFVLSELLGHGDVKNYDGSWTEYGSLVNVPVERG
ncbi:MAG TPA: sulfurtransferase [Acidimicrobiia bacterium]|jgi:thiosulfate/3-mercaptopyruvate sulfurtransferase